MIDKFLGYPKLIAQTHDFFLPSLIYYNERADLMRVEGQVFNRGYDIISWVGQAGGFKGWRQKGWSIVTIW